MTQVTFRRGLLWANIAKRAEQDQEVRDGRDSISVEVGEAGPADAGREFAGAIVDVSVGVVIQRVAVRASEEEACEEIAGAVVGGRRLFEVAGVRVGAAGGVGLAIVVVIAGNASDRCDGVRAKVREII